MDIDAVSEAIKEVAERLILPRFRTLTPDQIDEKEPGDLVTVADREAEVELTAILGASDPDALVVGEEAVYADQGRLSGLSSAEHAWLIDPVDGTKNFARGSADFGVMVAELRRGLAVRAWIWQPVHGIFYVAEMGSGVTANGRPLAAPAVGDPSDPMRGAVPRSLRRGAVPGLELGPTCGACAIDYPRLFTGRLDFLGYRKMHAWDHVPGVLMLTELGGHAAVRGGRPYAAGVTGTLLVSANSLGVWRRADAALESAATAGF